MTMLPKRYIHGIPPDAAVIDQFGAAAAEADFHLSEALKSMAATLAYFESKAVVEDMRKRGVQIEYSYKAVEAQMAAIRENKLGFSILMFGADIPAPSVVSGTPMGTAMGMGGPADTGGAGNG